MNVSVPMTTISLLTIAACVLGQAGIVPQLARMVRARSAAGQSPIGWMLGGLTNACLLYINLAGYHALMLAVSNTLGLLLCVACTAATLRLGDRPPPDEPFAADITALPTQEFEVLVQDIRAARVERRAPLPA
jgi:hypothetical protein